MFPLILLALGGAAFLYEKSASASGNIGGKGNAPWQLRMLRTPKDPPIAAGVPVLLSLYNMTSGEVRNVTGQTVSEEGADGNTTVLLGIADGPTPYGYEPGKMVTVAHAYLYPLTPKAPGT